MKMLKLSSLVLLLCLAVTSNICAQQQKPFMTYYFSEKSTVQKDTSGNWGDWHKEKNLKTIVFDFFLQDLQNLNPADKKVELYYFKNKKPVDSYTYSNTDSKEDKGYTILILNGAKNSTGKPCTIEIKRSLDRSSFALAKTGFITIKYADEWIEYTGTML